MAELTERELIDGTIADISESIEDLDSRIEVLMEERQQKMQRLEAWKKKLGALAGAPAPVHKRAQKGANLRSITACLSNTVEGISANEIRVRTGLAWSSLQRVLAQNGELFVETNGLWKLQRRPKTENGVVASNEIEEAEVAE